MTTQSLQVVVLAAGQGKRMHSRLPKVLHPLGGRPMLLHVLESARPLAPTRLAVVIGHGGEAIAARLEAPDVVWALQERQLGTGHAVMHAMPKLEEKGVVLVLYGDVPLVQLDTLARLVAAAGPNAVSLLSVMLPDPTGYGRKTLLSNACTNDCKYCPLRSEANVRRCSLRPEEVANMFMEYLRRKMAFGLFLSSAAINSPDYTMEKINAVARLLRYRHNFRGYIHLKIIPGASDAAIEDTLSLATVVSLNIETPGEKRFDLLSNKKDYMKDIVHPLKLLGKLTARGNRFSRVKCTTQFIVGASDETDSEIIDYMFGLYNRLNFKRVYFSAYQKGLGHPDIPGEKQLLSNPVTPFIREHRLYQADFLIRKYGFTKKDIIPDEHGNLRLDKDPKEVWADNHPEYYPVRINTSDKEALLKVPGLGPNTVSRILNVRRERRITRPEDLGIKGKRVEKIKNYAIFE